MSQRPSVRRSLGDAQYELLRDEEENVPAQHVEMVAVSEEEPDDTVAEGATVGQVEAALITGEENSSQMEAEEQPLIRPPSNDSEADTTVVPVEGVDTPPPAYNVATNLPSYEEAERTKVAEAAAGGHLLHQRGCGGDSDCECFMDPFLSAATHHDFPDVDSSTGALTAGNDAATSDQLLGNDLVFFCTFVVAFLFNWIGFLFSVCLSQTIAGRYGALAGFGLSLMKWTVIVQHSTELLNQTDWFWWLLLVFGMMMFMRGLVQYIRVKAQWNSLSAHTRQRLVYFYY